MNQRKSEMVYANNVRSILLLCTDNELELKRKESLHAKINSKTMTETASTNKVYACRISEIYTASPFLNFPVTHGKYLAPNQIAPTNRELLKKKTIYMQRLDYFNSKILKKIEGKEDFPIVNQGSLNAPVRKMNSDQKLELINVEQGVFTNTNTLKRVKEGFYFLQTLANSLKFIKSLFNLSEKEKFGEMKNILMLKENISEEDLKEINLYKKRHTLNDILLYKSFQPKLSPINKFALEKLQTAKINTEDLKFSTLFELKPCCSENKRQEFNDKLKTNLNSFSKRTSQAKSKENINTSDLSKVTSSFIEEISLKLSDENLNSLRSKSVHRMRTGNISYCKAEITKRLQSECFSTSSFYSYQSSIISDAMDLKSG